MERPPDSRRRRTRAGLAALAVVTAAAVIVIVLCRDQLFAKRFAVVEPGAVYRGGYNEPVPLKRIITKHGVKHILCLMKLSDDDPRSIKERRTAAETGADLKVLPMPGNGCADFDSLDRAADIIADAANRPLLVHCAAGVQRTGAAIAAYRMKHCGWTYEEAIAEAERHGLDRDDNPELYAHLKEYAARLAGAARRAAERPAATSEPAASAEPAAHRR